MLDYFEKMNGVTVRVSGDQTIEEVARDVAIELKKNRLIWLEHFSIDYILALSNHFLNFETETQISQMHKICINAVKISGKI